MINEEVELVSFELSQPKTAAPALGIITRAAQMKFVSAPLKMARKVSLILSDRKTGRQSTSNCDLAWPPTAIPTANAI